MTVDEAMERAIELAWHGWGRVEPNPLVGAVVLHDGKVVGEGFHAMYGHAHAERVALDEAGGHARNGTLVVTLEPCAHHGHQPPCVDRIVEAGIRSVVYAISDPNPVAHGGAARLKAAGIAVTSGPGAPAVTAQNSRFLHRFRVPERPYVALKMATSLDGRLAHAGDAPGWLTGPEAREWVHWLRAGFDAIAVGSGTVLSDDPRLTVRGEVAPRLVPRRVIFDRRLRTPPDAQAVDSGTIVVSAPHASRPAKEALQARGATILESTSMRTAMVQLRQAGVTSMLVEGGGVVASALQAEGLIDRYYALMAPRFLGHAAVPAWPNSRDDGATWAVVERQQLGADTLLVVDRR